MSRAIRATLALSLSLLTAAVAAAEQGLASHAATGASQQNPAEREQQTPESNWPEAGEAAGSVVSTAVLLSESAGQRTTQSQPREAGVKLQDFEAMALSHNPTLPEAQDQTQAAAGRRLQAGLYPNPSVGYEGAEIRGGSFRGGEQGFFVQQDIVLGSKLGLGRKIFEEERQQAQTEADEQRLRVLNGVRLLFYQALAAQSMVDDRRKLASLAQDAVETSRQLANVGQADRPDVLESEIERQEAELQEAAAEETFRRAWRALTATAGNPDLAPARLEGNLEDLPSGDPEHWLDAIVRDSPAVKIARLGVARAEAQLARARREPVPDLQLKAGVQQNLELQEPAGGPVGLQSFAEVRVQIPIFNRNQGNVQAASAEVARARREVERVQLRLRGQAATLVENYDIARATAERYRKETLPLALKAYQLYLDKYRTMGAAYPQVLITQRTMFQLETDYISALAAAWTNALALQGFMLTDGLEAPSRPSELETPVREINLPSASATLSEK
jgi:outer membrane protein, heavy metal efflux system